MARAITTPPARLLADLVFREAMFTLRHIAPPSPLCAQRIAQQAEGVG
jgi:hypothetical protein